MVRLTELGDVVGTNAAAAAGRSYEPLTATLRDGTQVALRPIQPDDKPRLQGALQLLSPRSRYLRFHARLDHLTDEQLRYATEVDHRDHVAWLVLDVDHPDVPAIALGQYARLETNPRVAEASITVIDRYQARGLGTMLLAILAEVAITNGIEVFRNYVLADNDAMLELFDQLGAERQPITSEVQEVDLRLPRQLADLPDTPAGRAIRALADEGSHHSSLAAVTPPVWIQRLRRRRAAPKEPPTPAVPHWRERGPFADWIDAALADADEDAAGLDADADQRRSVRGCGLRERFHRQPHRLSGGRHAPAAPALDGWRTACADGTFGPGRPKPRRPGSGWPPTWWPPPSSAWRPAWTVRASSSSTTAPKARPPASPTACAPCWRRTVST
jgi:GNAT superfamily N-acetyltransferase